MAEPMSVTLGSRSGSMPFQSHALRDRRRHGQHAEADDGRRRADHLRPRPARRRDVELAGHLTHVHVRGRADDPVAHFGLDAGHEAERDDERHDPDTHPGDRHRRDQRNERLPAAGGQIAARDEPGERHLLFVIGYWLLALTYWLLGHCPSSSLAGRISGNRITSRIDALFVMIMTSRSMPMPSPPVGGSPYSRARM